MFDLHHRHRTGGHPPSSGRFGGGHPFRPLSLVLLLVAGSTQAGEPELLQPLPLHQVITVAGERRAEIAAARARLAAARERPAIVSALEDPMISPAIDHKPVDPMMGTDTSITIEQRFPLSRILTHKRHAAEADARRLEAETDRTVLSVGQDAAGAFLMLAERRQMRGVLMQQQALAVQIVETSAARYASGAGTQADVLRAETESARLAARLLALTAEIRGAEIMLNTAMGREADLPIPELAPLAELDGIRLPSLASAAEQAWSRRPESAISQAEIMRTQAESRAMRSMYLPMAMVRTGMADTAEAGRGYMLMVGISLPIWVGKLTSGVREAKAMEEMAVADSEAMRRMVNGEAGAALESLRGALDRWRGLRDDVQPRAERMLAPALSAYAAGKLPLSSVLETAQALRSVQEERISAEYEAGMALVRVHAALGDLGDAL